MKKTIQTIALISLSTWGGSLYSQGLNNLLSPIGKVGIGTLAPQARFHVIGSVKIDSNLTVARNLVANYQSTFAGLASFQNGINVLGLANLNATTISGIFKLPALNDIPTEGQIVDVLMRDPITGKVLKGGGDELKSLVYREVAELPCRDDNGGYTTPALLTWANGPGKLFTPSHCVPNPLVGIGTNNPTAKLNIRLNEQVFSTHAILVQKSNGEKLMQLDKTGLLYAREMKVNLDSWPDYVFEEGYQLMPTKTLEDYVLTNKHLPGVPNACEIEENGLSLGEMNKILLEKLEEMTLRMIDQEKRIVELEATSNK